MKRKYPILEFDPDTEAIIAPQSNVEPLDNMPEGCVICFFQEVIDHLLEEGLLQEIASLRSEMGRHPVYELKTDEQSLALFHPGIGAPFAAGMLEEAIALGSRRFIACGAAGVLDSSIGVGHVLVPISAVRDEGTSYHYLPPSREVKPSSEAVEAIKRTLTRRNVHYLLTKTWTTDGLYRETPGRIALRRSEGCLAVEMEAAALFAVAQFRKVHIGQILCGGDDVGGETWDKRGWTHNRSVKEQLVHLAAEACLELGREETT